MPKTTQPSLEDTGERMIPGFHKGTVMYAEHITRYMAAQELVKDKVVLDIASGSGYGTKMLSETAKMVYGVDIDADSIDYAKNNFAAKNIDFKVGDGEKIPLPDNSVDVVVTFETIEHVPNYKQFIKEIKRILRDDGIAIVSTPNEAEFTKGNHFHLHEFVYEELVDLLEKDFKNIDSYFQATWVSVAIAPEDYIAKESVHSYPNHNLKPLTRDKYLYFYLVCSNRRITEKVKPVNAFGGHYSARELTDIQQLNDKNLADHRTVLSNANIENERILSEYQKIKAENELLKQKLEHTLTHKITNKAKSVKKALGSHGSSKN